VIRFLAVPLMLVLLSAVSPAMAEDSSHHAIGSPMRVAPARKPSAAKLQSASRVTLTRSSSSSTHSVVQPFVQSSTSQAGGLVFSWDSERQGDHPRNCVVSDATRAIVMPWFSSLCDGAREQWAEGQFTALSTQSAPARVAVQGPSPGEAPSTAVINRTPGLTFLPKGTHIAVHTMAGYNSYASLAGEKIRYEVTDDVVVDGFVIAKAGDTAYGKVQEASRGECGVSFIICWAGPKGSSLRVSVDEVYNFCGDTIHVDFDRSEYRSGAWSGFGLFGNNKDIVIAKGQQYLAEADRPQRVCGAQTTSGDLPARRQALRTSDH
jgi:hypothetical protein